MQYKTLRQSVTLLSLLGAVACAPAWSASAIYQNTGDSESIELSNLESDEAAQTPLVNEVVTRGAERVARDVGEAGSVTISGSADATEFQPRPKRGELTVATVTADSKNPVAIPRQQQYQDLMRQQASFNGGPNGNQYAARKYLKVDRATYQNALNN
jgi:hypothetical protein